MLTDLAASYLHAAVLSGLNIVVLGPTGVGKTTMLTALGRCIPVGERIMLIEDTPEIKLHPETTMPMNVIPVRTRPPSMEGVPGVLQEDLVRLALRQRPSALTLGEARGAEIYDLLNALMTGHKNGLTSLHTFSANEMFDRIFLMLAQSEKGRLLDMARAAKLVASTLNIAITLEAVGRVRRVVSITEFTGDVSVEGGRPRPALQEVFRHTGPRGSLQGPLVPSTFARRFAEMGVPQKFFAP
jgi:pilus assembly protein CpaF